MATTTDDMMVASEDFATEIDGIPYTVQKGKTRVRRGDPLHAARPESWEALDVSPTVEAATKNPGEKRGATA